MIIPFIKFHKWVMTPVTPHAEVRTAYQAVGCHLHELSTSRGIQSLKLQVIIRGDGRGIQGLPGSQTPATYPLVNIAIAMENGKTIGKPKENGGLMGFNGV